MTELPKDLSVAVNISIRELDALTNEEQHSIFAGRKQTFIDELEWDLPEYDGSDEERDAFDGEHTRYMLIYENGELRFSARFLPYEHSMVATLWPEYLEGIPKSAVEISRFVSHSDRDTRFSRMASAQLKFLLRHRGGYRDLFGTADDRIERYYSLILQMPPVSSMRLDKYPGIYRGHWRL